ncbi:hypothetical protein HCAG_04516 [Histoplasma mississippiense (nom. inval.)]|uniref:hypothetical protein n=1 Tax=Ajellomyces capsulatus (strain NAm1 / WU24) TaxID=2059318 RepID=UPI000157C17F|nr:hypothetical protein HCAG_04516 [Histoplasma mississippiense (nom. inval.)]EDN08006.1 hypothetical protein HCAG_04516 [Histoplasma mississippiense (nom. inval.)]
MLQAAQGMGMTNTAPGADAPNLIDNSETVHISSLALLKMLRHGRAGVPMEVMGLMLGDFVDEFTVRVVDVFAMPQSGTGVSVEAVDPVFQTKMMEMLRQTGRPETIVGCLAEGYAKPSERGRRNIEDVAQQLIEDNIVAVSRQMIDKEASLARETSKNGMQTMDTSCHSRCYYCKYTKVISLPEGLMLSSRGSRTRFLISTLIAPSNTIQVTRLTFLGWHDGRSIDLPGIYNPMHNG